MLAIVLTWVFLDTTVKKRCRLICLFTNQMEDFEEQKQCLALYKDPALSVGVVAAFSQIDGGSTNQNNWFEKHFGFGSKSHNTFHLSFDTEINLLRICPKGMEKQMHSLHCIIFKCKILAIN